MLAAAYANDKSPSPKTGPSGKSSATPGSNHYDQFMSAGESALKNKNYPAAEQSFAKALAETKKFKETDERISNVLNQQITLFYAEGKLANAAPVIKQLINFMQSSRGIDSPSVIESLKNYKQVLQRIGDAHGCDVVENRLSSLEHGGDGEHSHIANLVGASINDDDAAFLLNGLEKEIWQLDAYGSKISDKTMQLLKNFSHLEKIDLSSTKVTDAGLANLKGKSTIRMLNLGSTAVTDAGMQNLYSLEGLKFLGLSSTAVSPKAIAALQKALPKCKVNKQ